MAVYQPKGVHHFEKLPSAHSHMGKDPLRQSSAFATTVCGGSACGFWKTRIPGLRMEMEGTPRKVRHKLRGRNGHAPPPPSPRWPRGEAGRPRLAPLGPDRMSFTASSSKCRGHRCPFRGNRWISLLDDLAPPGKPGIAIYFVEQNNQKDTYGRGGVRLSYLIRGSGNER